MFEVNKYFIIEIIAIELLTVIAQYVGTCIGGYLMTVLFAFASLLQYR